MGEDPDELETPSLNYFLNPSARGADRLEDNSYTNSQRSADDKRGGSIEAYLHTAQLMVPDSQVRPCYIYIVNSFYP
jgi:hypothetical protein